MHSDKHSGEHRNNDAGTSIGDIGNNEESVERTENAMDPDSRLPLPRHSRLHGRGPSIDELLRMPPFSSSEQVPIHAQVPKFESGSGEAAMLQVGTKAAACVLVRACVCADARVPGVHVRPQRVRACVCAYACVPSRAPVTCAPVRVPAAACAGPRACTPVACQRECACGM
eukprot:2578620-Pleurochrysis_carterae.AAC.1